jgi:NADH-ubiquinone oxidoreductase chain 6
MHGETVKYTEDFYFSYIVFIIIIGGILVLFIYITRHTSNEIFSPSNKITLTASALLPVLLIDQ